ncbi:hypothetical protein ACFWQJ_11855, partial [Kocuria palustris]|uniref:hypothetical protein n=1 Tax=Kocuria palustris TaxID=71999 RepID=UPI00365C7F98
LNWYQQTIWHTIEFSNNRRSTSPFHQAREDQVLAGPCRCVIRSFSTCPKHSVTLPVALPQVNSPFPAVELSEILRRAACSP